MDFDVYAIKDLEKGDFAQPFFVPQGTPVEHIKINFKRLIEKGDSELSYFPDRFELWQLGVYDSNHGCFLSESATIDPDEPLKFFECVCKGTDYARPEYLKALAEAKANMENDNDKLD